MGQRSDKQAQTLPLRIYNNKTVIGNLGIPIHLGCNEGLMLGCIALLSPIQICSPNSDVDKTHSATEEVSLLTNYQRCPPEIKPGPQKG